MIASRITSKGQTTVPQPVRLALRLHEGDEVAYEIRNGEVVMTKAGLLGVEELFATLEEWSSEADEKAYADL